MEVKERREKIILKTLELSYKHKKGLLNVLIKIYGKNGLENLNIDVLKEGSAFNLLNMMIDTREILYTALHDEYSVIYELWSSLSDKEKKTLFEKIIEDDELLKNYEGIVFNLMDDRITNDFNEGVMAEKLYDVSFVEKAIKSGIPFENINNIDYKRIIANQQLLDLYAKNTPLFTFNMDRRTKLTNEEAEKLVNYGFVWCIKYCEQKNNFSFLYEMITKYPQKFNIEIIKEIMQSVNQQDLLLFTLAISSANVALKLNDKNFVRQNLYSIGIQNSLKDPRLGIGIPQFAGSDYCSFNQKQYLLLNPTLAPLTPEIENTLTEEELNYYNIVSYSSKNEKIDDAKLRVDSAEKNIVNKKRFKNFLSTCCEQLNIAISDEQLTNFIKSYPHIINELSDKNLLSNVRVASNICYAIQNNTLDLYYELMKGYESPEYIVSMKYIDKELINILGNDVIKNIAIYPDSIFYLMVLKQQGRLNEYVEILNKVQNLPINQIQLYNILIYSCISYPKFVDNMIKTNSVTEDNVMKLINFTRCVVVNDVNQYNNIDEADKGLQEYFDKKIELSNNIDVTKELFCQKYFGTCLSGINDLYNSFSESIQQINNEKLKNIIKTIEVLLNSNDMEEIKKAFKNINRNNALELECNLKADLLKDFIPKMNTNKTSKDIIDLTNKNFNLLVHVVGAYGSTIDANSLYESWNSESRYTNTGICTSLINENYFGRAPQVDSSVIFVFDNIQGDSIQMMGPYDLWSKTSGLSSYSGRSSVYCKPKTLVNKTRDFHNEVVINRKLADGTKRQPRYILCFDKINEESKKASQEFNVPILFIDTEKHIENKNNIIEEAKQEYINSQNPELAQGIIQNMRTTRCGLLANNKDIAEKYFSQKMLETTIIGLIENSVNIENVDRIIDVIYKEYNLTNDAKNDSQKENIKINIDLILQKAMEQKKKIEQGYKLQTTQVNQNESNYSR